MALYQELRSSFGAHGGLAAATALSTAGEVALTGWSERFGVHMGRLGVERRLAGCAEGGRCSFSPFFGRGSSAVGPRRGFAAELLSLREDALGPREVDPCDGRPGDKRTRQHLPIPSSTGHGGNVRDSGQSRRAVRTLPTLRATHRGLKQIGSYRESLRIACEAGGDRGLPVVHVKDAGVNRSQMIHGGAFLWPFHDWWFWW